MKGLDAMSGWRSLQSLVARCVLVIGRALEKCSGYSPPSTLSQSKLLSEHPNASTLAQQLRQLLVLRHLKHFAPLAEAIAKRNQVCRHFAMISRTCLGSFTHILCRDNEQGSAA